jgi:hypothetical protein
MIRTRLLAVVVLCGVLMLGYRAGAALVPGAKAEPAFDPIDRYREQRLEGWTVLVNRRLDPAEHQTLRAGTLKLLADHLYRISCAIPARPLAKLRKIPIWVELADPRHPCMCYHPSPHWLGAHGMNPQKAGSVEIANARNFLTWTAQQPWMVLHELAHGYHHQVLGFDHAGIRACYQRAAGSHRYDAVLRCNGHHERAYAMNKRTRVFRGSDRGVLRDQRLLSVCPCRAETA